VCSGIKKVIKKMSRAIAPRFIGKYKLSIILLLFVISLLLTGCGDNGGNTTKVSKKTPDFSLQTLDGQTLTRDGLKGKVVLLDFWATWCPPCRAAIPHLVELYEKHKDDGLVVVGVSLDKKPDAVRDFVKRNNVPYPVAIGSDNPIVKDMGNISSLPTLILLDRKGAIQLKIIGFNAEIGARIEEQASKLLQ
jgi:thiol-disulfide isomerase/thioredoxin